MEIVVGNGADSERYTLDDRLFVWRFNRTTWFNGFWESKADQPCTDTEDVGVRDELGDLRVQQLEELGFQVFWHKSFGYKVSHVMPPSGWKMIRVGGLRIGEKTEFQWYDDLGNLRFICFWTKRFDGLDAYLEFYE